MSPHRSAQGSSLSRQLGLRLGLMLLVVVVGIGIIGTNSYLARYDREVSQKSDLLARYYRDLLPQIEERWHNSAARLARYLIEHVGLEELLTADAALAGQVTGLIEGFDFQRLELLAADGSVLLALAAGEAYRANHSDSRGTPERRWRIDPIASDLLRTILIPVAISGRVAAVKLEKRIDSDLLQGLAAPETRLRILWQQHVVDSQPLHRIISPRSGLLQQTGSGDVIEMQLAWPGDEGGPLLTIQQVFHDSYPMFQFFLRPVGAIVLIIVTLWLVLGGWLRGTVRRITALGAASHCYADGRSVAAVSDVLAPAADRSDEIGEVAFRFAELVETVEERESEQRVYLETLAMLDEAVLELNCDGTLVRASPGWQRLLQLEEPGIGRRLVEFVHPEDGDALQTICHTFQSGDRAQAQARLRLVAGRSERDLWVECRFVACHDGEQQPVGMRGVLRDITQTYLQERQIAHMALHDSLTGLPNRLLFEDRLKHAMQVAERTRHLVAVGFIDIDHFKNINDTLGHKVGDQLIGAYSELLRKALRAGDTLARWGGDEFVMLLPDIASPGDVIAVVDKLIAVSQRPFRFDQATFRASLSMGIALYPDDGDRMEMLLAQADRAMFYAKAQGRNQACLVKDMVAEEIGEEGLFLRNRLAEAVARNQIEAWFQPVIEAKSGRCVGAEVLARWRDGENGWVSPALFIPAAEAIGVIGELGQQVWNRAIEAAAEWKSVGYDLRVAVNRSRRQLFSPQLSRTLLYDLEKSGLTTANVVLEITESMALLDVANASERLHELERAGFDLALDDFGTGYSSLSQLHEMPVGELKIDISFVRRIHEPSGRSMVQAIIDLAGALDLLTVAEGVEDEETARKLTAMGATQLQGYHFARPMPFDEFTAWLVEGLHQQAL
jgi:diguanylate cyclase (GGDEF)-like protein